MALTNIELYEALKKDLSEDAARMIAEVVPAAQDLATKADVARLEALIARVEARISALGQDLGDRMLKYFVPLWIAVFGALASMVGLIVVLQVGK